MEAKLIQFFIMTLVVFIMSMTLSTLGLTANALEQSEQKQVEVLLTNFPSIQPSSLIPTRSMESDLAIRNQLNTVATLLKVSNLQSSTHSVMSSIALSNAGSGITATCKVTTSADSGAGSLRQCLLNATDGTLIDFDSTIFPPTKPTTISVQSMLPAITVNDLTIDGSNAGVILDGGNRIEGAGLVITGTARVAIQGMQIINFLGFGIALMGGANNCTIGGSRAIGEGPLGQGNLLSNNRVAGIWIEGETTTGNQIKGNFVGTTLSGVDKLANGRIGIVIGAGSDRNYIGGHMDGERNIISGNKVAGIWLEGNGTEDNKLYGNYIGVDITGKKALGNDEFGIVIGYGASNNIVGGNTETDRNIISGNGKSGIRIVSINTTGNQIVGNYIGTDISGENALGNKEDGIVIFVGASANIVGGSKPEIWNVISGNGASGIILQDPNTAANIIAGNYIGTDKLGFKKLANDGQGIAIFAGANNNIIGGNTPQNRNVISGNAGFGISIQNSSTVSNVVIGNYIGTNISGTIAISNGGGIGLGFGTHGNIIGSDNPELRNIISGNGTVGVLLQDDDTSSNEIIGNYIGVDVSGKLKISNQGGIGIIGGARNNRIGGDREGTGNIISGNTNSGILIQDINTQGNRVIGNYIGVDVSGTKKVANGLGGVGFIASANQNIVGGATPEQRNIISGNELTGVWLRDSETSDNQVIGNYIGIDVSGTKEVGNTSAGVAILLGASRNIIGGSGSSMRNVISANDGAGIFLLNTNTNQNQVVGNFIGSDASGTQALGNKTNGIEISSAASENVIGGNKVGEGNLISGNESSGIKIAGVATRKNQVIGNFIGTDMTGAQPIPNMLHGIHLTQSASFNIIGENNTILYNKGAGIAVDDKSSTGNTITRNQVYLNSGKEISRAQEIVSTGLELTLDYYSSTEQILEGHTCAKCKVEIFSNPSTEPAGTEYIGTTTALENGVFIFQLSSSPAFTYFSGTATDSTGSTSEFAPSLDITTLFTRKQYLPIIIK